MNRGYGTSLAALLFLIMSQGQAWSLSEASPGVATCSTIAELESGIRGVLERSGIPGAGVVLVDRQGSLWTGGVGLANVATGGKVTSKTLFRVGSITKTFVAIAILQLQEQGRLHLTDRLDDLAPDVKIANPWERTDPVRLEHLLEHTAGLDEINLAQWADDAGTGRIAESLPLLASILRCRWRPGTLFSYSNADSVVAGTIIERASSEPFEQYVIHHILKPLGMETALLQTEAAAAADLARSYRRDGVTAIPPRPSRFRPSGALIASPEDMGRFLRMLILRGSLEGRQILRPDSISRMEHPRTTLAARAGIECGYGAGLQGIIRNGFLFQGHGGGTSGFLSEFGYLPDQGLGYFFSVNAGHDPAAVKAIGDLIARFLTRECSPPAPPEPAWTGKSWDSLTGYYEPITLRNEAGRFSARLVGIRKVTATSAGLEISSLLGPLGKFPDSLGFILKTLINPLLAAPTELVPAGPDRFRKAEEPVATVIFLQDPEGVSIMQNPGATFRRIPDWVVWGQSGLALLVIFLMVSAGLLAVLWIPRYLRHGALGVPDFGIRFLAWIPGPILCSVILLWECGGDEVLELMGKRTILSVSVWILGWAFVGSSWLGPVFLLRTKASTSSRWVWIHSFLVSLANTAMAVYLVYWQQFQRTWVP